MVTIGKREIVEAALRIILQEDRRITFHLSPEEVSIQIPTTRRLAEHLGIPHYYVLPYFAEMEKDGYIKRIERVGISTTPRGTGIAMEIIVEQFEEDILEILGRELFDQLRERIDEMQNEG